MGYMLKCDEMALCDMYLQHECAFEIMSEIGDAGCVQFLDMKPEATLASRVFYPEIKRLAEMERKLQFIAAEMTKDKINVDIPLEDPRALKPNEMTEFENELDSVQTETAELAANHTHLLKNYLEMTELLYVMTQIGPILGNSEIQKDVLLKSKAGAGDVGLGGRLSVITGVVRRSKFFAFETMLWRISRGNIYFKPADADAVLLDPHTQNEIRKVAFVIVCQGEALISRVEKVCSGFHANIYSCPESEEARLSVTSKVDRRLDDLVQVLKKTEYHRCKALHVVAKKMYPWTMKVLKAKAVYVHLNYFTLDITKQCLIGQCWIPTLDLPRVCNILETCSETKETNVPSFLLETKHEEIPPTFNRTNKFTHGFQVLINAYGESRYREMNPGLYTIITFPFLFAVMFGDFGHSMLIIAFAGWMLYNEKKFMAEKSTSEIWNIFFGGRYIILFMGLFSMYTGFLYNDAFSKSFNISGSNWLNSLPTSKIGLNSSISMDPKIAMRNRPYYFGLDPCWALAPKNKILHDNSVKMKMSIILGAAHMLFGLSLSVFNHIHFKEKIAIILEFIPQLTFMCCILLWLVFLIYYKWWNYGPLQDKESHQPGCAPMILILFIDMMLMKESKPVSEGCEPYMIPGQRTIQMVLLTMALLSVPVLLLAMPIYKVKTHPNVNIGELMTHQAIHTIEFVLSTISHTASYLRLWALSLAHAQLTEMLWEMILVKLALHDRSILGIPKLFVIFSIWAAFTLSILVLMEGMSAFLHTLRLHWVEFMSKFFLGGGILFAPFSFGNIIIDFKKEG